MYSANIKNYKRIEVESASSGKLLLMLYDGAIEFLHLAEKYIDENNTLEAKHYIGRTQAIITELMSTLNMDAGEIAGNLFMLYQFMLNQLIEVHNADSFAGLQNVRTLLEGLRESWESIISKRVESPSASQEGPGEDQDQSVSSGATGYSVPPRSEMRQKSLNLTG